MLKAALSRMDLVFDTKRLARGREYERQGQVLSARLSDGLLKGRVKGRSNEIYDVYIDLKTWPTSPSRCNCPMSSSCEHAAACLFYLQNQNRLEGGLTHSESTSKWQRQSNDLFREEISYADEVIWYSDLSAQRNDFFGYQLGILVDGKSVNIVPLIADLLDQSSVHAFDSMPDDKRIKLPFAKGRSLEVTLGRIKPLLRFLMQYTESSGAQEELHIRPYQLLLMQEVERAVKATSSRWQATEILQRQLQQLTTVSSLPQVKTPLGLKVALRDYQHQGLSWLQFLRQSQFSGILADDMGLGKTIQTLASLQYEKEQGRLQHASLIVAPTSLVGNWLDEIKRFTPELSVLVFHGATRHRDEFDEFDVVISTYGLIQRDKTRFLKHQFYYLILDEAQFIKNSRSKTTQIIQQVTAKHRVCLTGTPLENHLGELWSLFHFLMPGLLGNAKQFRQHFRIPIEKQGDAERREMLMRRVQPFMLRRTKNQVARELPPKTEILRTVELTGAQRDLYETIRMSMEKKVRDAIAKQGLGKSQIVVLDALLKLRQVCCDPRLVSLPSASMAHGHSAKLDLLMEMLDDLIQEGRFVLVFSQFTSMLELIEQQLIKRQWRYLKLTGQTQNRHDVVTRFQQGEASVFLISLKAGGTGLNLTKADTVILYDPWWNPAVQDQAMGRSHRIGQEHPVFVYQLIGAGTVEEKIVEIQDKKRLLFDGILSNQSSGGVGLTQEDIDQFFMPLA